MDVRMTFTKDSISEKDAMEAVRFFTNAIHDSLDTQEKNRARRHASRDERILNIDIQWRTTSNDQPAAIKVAILDSKITDEGSTAIGTAFIRMAQDHLKGAYSLMLDSWSTKIADTKAA